MAGADVPSAAPPKGRAIRPSVRPDDVLDDLPAGEVGLTGGEQAVDLGSRLGRVTSPAVGSPPRPPGAR
jgi:hypothetical protein